MDIEQSTLIWIFRGVYILLSLLLAFGLWQFIRRERYIHVSVKKEYQIPKNITLPEKNIILTLHAQPGRFFDPKRLYQALEHLGFIFSENQIFEYLLDDQKTILFSLINQQKPGYFDNDINSKKRVHVLVAILQLPIADGANQLKYFHLFLSILNSLSDLIGATLCDANNQMIKEKRLAEIQQEIERFETIYSESLNHAYNTRNVSQLN